MEYNVLISKIKDTLKSENEFNGSIQYLLLLTGSEEFKQLILSQHDLITNLTTFTSKDIKDVSNMNCLIDILINLSTEEKGAKTILNIDVPLNSKITSPRDELVKLCVSSILDKNNELADLYCKLLCNLSRSYDLANYITSIINESNVNQLVNAYCNLKYNTVGASLDYLGAFFANMCQTTEGVERLCARSKQLLKYIDYDNATIRRYGTAAMLKNISMHKDKQKWLLSKKDLNVLPQLLLPLIDVIPETELQQLPMDLKSNLENLQGDKKKEPDPEIRLMLIETLFKLCNEPEMRIHMRENKVYIILREIHKTEKDSKVINVCENVVNILLRTEDEIGVGKLDSLNIPEDLELTFKEADKKSEETYGNCAKTHDGPIAQFIKSCLR